MTGRDNEAKLREEFDHIRVTLGEAIVAMISMRSAVVDVLAVSLENDQAGRVKRMQEALNTIKDTGERIERLTEAFNKWPSW